MYKIYKQGDFGFIFESVFFRKLTHIKGSEIIRNVYPAVRDRNWGTVPPQTIHESVRELNHEIIIEQDLHFRQNDIDFRADFSISVKPEGLFSFAFKGQAFSSFMKNRIGLNLLLPINELAGRKCTIVDAEDNESQGFFPKEISPHQPFKSIHKLKWKDSYGIQILASFEGDIFEMEDQRNWTDASYKIYPTPLSIPFPVEINEGEEVNQLINIQIDANEIKTYETKTWIFDVKGKQSFFRLPAIGTLAGSESSVLSNGEINALRTLSMDFLSLHLDLRENDWEMRFTDHLSHCQQIGLKAKLSILIPEHFHTPVKLIQLILDNKDILESVEFFNTNDFLSHGKVIEAIYHFLEDSPDKIKTGTGTYAYYAELNRAEFLAKPAEYITFSISPQVHATDNLSLIENLEGIHAVAIDAASKYKLPVDVNALSLKQRINFVATSDEKSKENGNKLPDTIDKRQATEFNAAWTLGAISRLMFAGVRSVSLFETVGRRGIMGSQEPAKGYGFFPEVPLCKYPVFYLLRELLKHKRSKFSPIKLPAEFLDAFFIQNDEGNEVWIWNYSDKEQDIPKELFKQPVHIRFFDYESGLWINNYLRNAISPCGLLSINHANAIIPKV